jgi:hypothetical protein
MTIDFTAHNTEVQRVWEAYREGRPMRTPMLLSANSRVWVLDPRLNRAGLTWKQFVSDPRLQLETQLQFRHYWAHNIPQDAEMGLPSTSWKVFVEFHNVVEENWFGCQIIYPEGQVSTSLPAYAGKRKDLVFEQDLPEPFQGIYGQMREFYEFFQQACQTQTFHDRPIETLPPGALATDGPLTIATGIRGPEILEDILNDEYYFHRLMDRITTAVIRRIRAWREYLHSDPLPQSGYFADDAIQFLSVRVYQDMVLPYHRRLLTELFGPGPHAMHLCGNVQRHLPTIIRELNVKSFDTGYPIHWKSLRNEIGDEVEIYGGVPVADLLEGTPQSIGLIAEAILTSGIRRGGKFVLKEANNLPPGVPIENIAAMYAAVKRL